MGRGTSCPTWSVSAPSPCPPRPDLSQLLLLGCRLWTVAFLGLLLLSSILTCTYKCCNLNLAQWHIQGYGGWDSCLWSSCYQGDWTYAEQTVTHWEKCEGGHGCHVWGE